MSTFSWNLNNGQSLFEYEEKRDEEMWILDYFVIISFITYIIYYFWYSFFGKTKQPLTLNEVDLLFVLHKKQAACTGTKISDLLLESGKVVGFKCECGYKYEQKRFLAQKVLRPFASDEFSGWVNPNEIEVKSETNKN